MPAALELKVEKPDKDEMRDDLSESKSDDESDKNLRTPRAGTRTRYPHLHERLRVVLLVDVTFNSTSQWTKYPL